MRLELTFQDDYCFKGPVLGPTPFLWTKVIIFVSVVSFMRHGVFFNLPSIQEPTTARLLIRPPTSRTRPCPYQAVGNPRAPEMSSGYRIARVTSGNKPRVPCRFSSSILSFPNVFHSALTKAKLEAVLSRYRVIPSSYHTRIDTRNVYSHTAK